VFETITERINEYREATLYMMNVIGDRKRAAEFLAVGEKLKKL